MPTSARSTRMTSRLSDAEWHRMHEERRAAKLADRPVPSYSDALCQVSRRLRQRSLPPAPPPPFIEPVRPRLIDPITGLRPPIRASSEIERPPASEYYKRYIKSMFEREPLFKDYIEALPAEDRNPYNKETLAKIRHDFENMIGDKWLKETGYDSSSKDDPSNLYPWRNAIIRDPEPASDRLRRLHAERRKHEKPDPLPKLRVYHQSTWNYLNR